MTHLRRLNKVTMHTMFNMLFLRHFITFAPIVQQENDCHSTNLKIKIAHTFPADRWSLNGYRKFLLVTCKARFRQNRGNFIPNSRPVLYSNRSLPLETLIKVCHRMAVGWNSYRRGQRTSAELWTQLALRRECKQRHYWCWPVLKGGQIKITLLNATNIRYFNKLSKKYQR